MKTQNSQLENDIALNARDRLTRWGEDTIMRCEVVGLDYRAIASILISCLAERLLASCKTLNIDVHTLLDTPKESQK